MCATLRATCGRPNRQSCRFVIARLEALVPRPRLNLTRFHGVFAPDCKHRESVVAKRKPRHEKPDKPLAPMTPMQRLKRVFAIDIETCPKCGGTLRVIACIENPDVIATILEHIGAREAAATGQAESASDRYRDPRRAIPGQTPVENDCLALRCGRYMSIRRCARPFRLQRPPPHPQPAHRTPLTTSHERSFNQSYIATIPFRAVIRPIRRPHFAPALYSDPILTRVSIDDRLSYHT